MSESPNQYLGSITPIAKHSLPALREQWRELEAAADIHFSLSWSWMESWLNLVEGQIPVYVFECKFQGAPVAMCFITLCKMKRMKGRLSVTQLQINEFLEKKLNMVVAYNGLVGVNRHLESAWGCFLNTAQLWNRQWDEIAIGALPERQYQKLVREQVSEALKIDKVFRCWRLELDQKLLSLDELIDQFKRKSRQQLRQTRKAYLELGKLSITAAETVEEAQTFFREMGAIHTRRWQRVGRDGSFANPNWVRFHENLIEQCFDHGQIQLLRVSCSGEPIGYLYGHLYRGTVYMHQTGFVESEVNKLRPGYVSHCLAMLYNIEKGNYCYDFLPDQDDSYKRFFVEAGAPVYWLLIQRPRLKLLVERVVRRLHSRGKEHAEEEDTALFSLRSLFISQ